MTPRPVGLVLALLVLAGCGGGGRAVEIDPQEAMVGTRWNATLATPAALAGATQVRGTGWMAEEEGESSQSRAHVSITNAVPGGEHPWHVHVGSCGNDRGIFGTPGAYRPLKVDGDGTAEEDAQLDVPLPSSGQYFINVHASANNMKTTIACGNLAPPSR